MEQSNFPIILI